VSPRPPARRPTGAAAAEPTALEAQHQQLRASACFNACRQRHALQLPPGRFCRLLLGLHVGPTGPTAQLSAGQAAQPSRAMVAGRNGASCAAETRRCHRRCEETNRSATQTRWSHKAQAHTRRQGDAGHAEHEHGGTGTRRADSVCRPRCCSEACPFTSDACRLCHPSAALAAGCQALDPASQVPADEEFDWAARYQPALRALPLAAGGAGLVGALLNRLLSGVRANKKKKETRKKPAKGRNSRPTELTGKHCFQQ